MKKKILVLGIGSAQLDAVRFLKDKDVEIHAVSNTDNGLALKYVDSFEKIDIVDGLAVLEYSLRHAVDVVYSVGSDFAMPTVGFVSKKLNLPYFADWHSATILNNKDSVRKILNHAKLSVVQYLRASSYEEISQKWKHFPAYFKPVDSQGQRGVFRVDSLADIKNHFDDSVHHSSRRKVIIEEFVDGQEISVNAFFYKNELKYCFVSDRLVVEDLPGGIAKGHRIPSSIPNDKLGELELLIEKSAKIFNISDGPMYFQIKYIHDQFKIIEITPRLDGCHLWRLIEMCYGVNLMEMTFSILLSGSVEFKKSNFARPLEIIFPMQPPATEFDRMLFSDSENNAQYVEYFYNEKDVVRPVNGYLEKVGLIIREW